MCTVEIVKLRFYHVIMRLREDFETSFGKTVDRHCVIVRVEDSEGNVGWGESPVDDGPWYSYETVETTLYVYRSFIVPIIKRVREFETPEDFLKAVERIRGYRMAKAGIEMALWDLYAKRLGKPLYKVLGGVRDKIVSGVSVGIIGDFNRLVKAVSHYLSKGYRRIKIKIKPGWDIEPVKVLRKEFGDIPLQVDANAAYTLNDAAIFKELDEYGLLMIEQPLHYDDLYEHSVLQRMLKTPICLDESVKSVYDAKAAIALGSLKVINIKPARVGGLTETKKIHDYAASHNIPVWIGGMLETGIGRGFQVAAATLPNVKYPNDISASDRYYTEDIVEPPWTLNSDGTISVPNKPGIGVEVLEEKLEKYSVKIIEEKVG